MNFFQKLIGIMKFGCILFPNGYTSFVPTYKRYNFYSTHLKMEEFHKFCFNLPCFFRNLAPYIRNNRLINVIF